MSFLYYNDQDPKTDANFRDVRAKNFWQWNHATEAYERVGAGGGSGEVPYWVQENSAQIGLTDAYKTVLTDRDMEVVNNDANTSSLLEADALTLGEVGVNHRLDAGSIDAANSLRDVAAGTSGKMLLYDASTKKLSHSDPVTLPDWVKPSSAEIGNSTQQTKHDHLGFRCRNHPGTSVAIARSYGFIAGTAPAGGLSFDLDNTRPFTELQNNLLRFFNGSGSQKILNYDNLDTLMKLHSATLSNPTAAKMIVQDTNGEFRRDDIPASIALPDWVKPTTAEFAGVNTDVSLGGRQLVFRERASTRATFVDDSSFTVGQTTVSGLLDTDKPYVSMRSGNVTFRDDSGNANALLTTDDVRVLNGIRVAAQSSASSNGRMLVWEPNGTYRRAPLPLTPPTLPKTYKFDIPFYPSGSTYANGASYFPRWQSENPGGQFWTGVASVQRCFRLAIGETIVLKSHPGIQGEPSLYYDTWYAVSFAPYAGFEHNPQDEMAVQGDIVKTQFPFGTVVEDAVETSIDVRVAPSPAVLGSIAFRINGRIITKNATPANPDPVKKKGQSDKFFGKISFKVLTYSMEGGYDIPQASIITLTP